MPSPASVNATPDRLMGIAWGYGPPLVIEAACRHQLFDHLEAGPKSADELATAAGVSPRGVRAVANLLTGLELLSKDAEGRYSLTPESAAFLVSTKPSYLGRFFLRTSVETLPRWMKLPEVVRTGQPASAVNQEAPGSEFFQQLVEDLFPMGYPAAKMLAAELRLAEARSPVSVLDLAAGSGVWSIALVQASPQAHATAVDWPAVLDVTRRVTARFGVADRYTFVAGDLDSADFGSGHNVATLGHILHSEGEERSKQLLAKTFAALAPRGTIAIQEFLVDKDRSKEMRGLLFAINMLVATDVGDTYSFEEISSWLQAAGFENPLTIQSPGPSPLILATKP